MARRPFRIPLTHPDSTPKLYPRIHIAPTLLRFTFHLSCAHPLQGVSLGQVLQKKMTAELLRKVSRVGSAESEPSPLSSWQPNIWLSILNFESSSRKHVAKERPSTTLDKEEFEVHTFSANVPEGALKVPAGHTQTNLRKLVTHRKTQSRSNKTYPQEHAQS